MAQQELCTYPKGRMGGKQGKRDEMNKEYLDV